jgi:hypothetical protein
MLRKKHESTGTGRFWSGVFCVGLAGYESGRAEVLLGNFRQPAGQRGMIGLKAPFGQYQVEVAIRDVVAKIDESRALVDGYGELSCVVTAHTDFSYYDPPCETR